jgi:hypothetical protein
MNNAIEYFAKKGSLTASELVVFCDVWGGETYGVRIARDDANKFESHYVTVMKGLGVFHFIKTTYNGERYISYRIVNGTLVIDHYHNWNDFSNALKATTFGSQYDFSE